MISFGLPLKKADPEHLEDVYADEGVETEEAMGDQEREREALDEELETKAPELAQVQQKVPARS